MPNFELLLKLKLILLEVEESSRLGRSWSLGSVFFVDVAYLRASWNVFDFLIIAVSVVFQLHQGDRFDLFFCVWAAYVIAGFTMGR